MIFAKGLGSYAAAQDATPAVRAEMLKQHQAGKMVDGSPFSVPKNYLPGLNAVINGNLLNSIFQQNELPYHMNSAPYDEYPANVRVSK